MSLTQYLLLRRSNVPGKVPTTESLALGEIAINTYDGLAFLKKSSSLGEEIITINNTGSSSNFFSGSITGSLFGTSSWAFNSLTSSYALTSSWTQNAISSSYSNNSNSSSYSLNSTSASYALTSSYSLTGLSSSYSLNSTSASYAISSSTSISSSRASTSSYTLTGLSSSYSLNTTSASYSLSGLSSSYASSSTSASYSLNSTSASYALSSSFIIPTGYLKLFDNGILTANYKNVTDNANNSSILHLSNNKLLISGSSTDTSGSLIIGYFESGSFFLSGSIKSNAGDSNGYNKGFINSLANLYSQTSFGDGPNRFESYIHLYTSSVSGIVTSSMASNMLVRSRYILHNNSSSYFSSVDIPNSALYSSLYFNADDSVNLNYIKNQGTGIMSVYWAKIDLSQNKKISIDTNNGGLSLYSGVVDVRATPGSGTIDLITDFRGGKWASPGNQTLSIGKRVGVWIEPIKNLFVTTSYAFYNEGDQDSNYFAGKTGINVLSPNYNLDVSGSVNINGLLLVTGSITGSLYGTSSWSENAITASYFSGSISNAVTASYVATASWAINAITASYFSGSISNAVTASYVATASWAQNSISSSYALNSTSASYSLTGLSSSYSLNSTSASYAISSSTSISSSRASTSSYALVGISSSYAFNSTTSSYSLTGLSSSYALNSTSASYAQTSSWAQNVISASYALTSSYAVLNVITASVSNTTITFTRGDGTTFSVTVAQSGSVATASYAIFSETSTSASYAQTSSWAQNAISSSRAITSSYSLNGLSSSYALNSTSASYAQTSSWAQNVISSSYSLTASYVAAAGSNTQVQYNKSGSLYADSNFTWDSGSRTLRLVGNGLSDLTNPVLKITDGSTSTKRLIQFDEPVSYSTSGRQSFPFVYQWHPTSNGDGTTNNVAKWGFNIDGSTSGQSGLFYSLEPDWVSGGVPYREAHLTYTYPSGSQVRLFSTTLQQRSTLRLTTNQWDFRSTTFIVKDLEDNDYFAISKTNGTGTSTTAWIGGTQPTFELYDDSTPKRWIIQNNGSGGNIIFGGLGISSYFANDANLYLNNVGGASGAAVMKMLYTDGNSVIFSVNGPSVGGTNPNTFYMYDTSTGRMFLKNFKASGNLILGNGASTDHGEYVQIVGTSYHSDSSSFASSVVITGSLTVSSSIYSTVAATAPASSVTNILSIQTGSYTSGFFDYTLFSGSNARAGTIISVWNGLNTQYYDNSTLDIGNTTDISMSVAITNQNLLLKATTNTSAWTVKAMYRLI